MRPTQNPSQGQKCLYFFGVPRTAVSNPKIAHRNGHLTVSCLLPTKLAFISFPKLLCIWYWSYFVHNCSVGNISQNFINCWNSLNSTGAINFPGKLFKTFRKQLTNPSAKPISTVNHGRKEPHKYLCFPNALYLRCMYGRGGLSTSRPATRE